jgi:membrane associated rhomboid family serine protease
LFPIRDENPTSRVTWMTWLLIVANLGLFGYMVWLSVTGGASALGGFVAANAFVPARFFAAPFSPREWATVLTAMFMHAGWLHIGGNMLYLWIFGNNVEDRLGALPFLGFYLACGTVATFAQAFVAPGTDLPNLGASGAVAGVLGAYLLLFPRARVVTAILIVFVIELTALPAWVLIAIWFVIQLGSGLGSIGAVASGGVAYFAHLGGFAAGLVLALPAWWRERERQTRVSGWR